MQAENYYQLLGVNRGASTEVLRRAFRSNVRETHPDRKPDDIQAAERTRLMVEAYQTLSDPAARRKYDIALEKAVMPPIPWAYVEAPYVAQWPRTVLLFIAAALAVALTVALARTALSSRQPVFTFQLTESVVDAQPTSAALLVEPDVMSSLAWYHAVEYQLGGTSALVAQQTTQYYTQALRDAENRGDRKSAEFYRASLREISRVNELCIPLGKQFGGTTSFAGPKTPVGSS